MDDSILLNLSGADHQLTEQLLVLLAERCFLFHSWVSSDLLPWFTRPGGGYPNGPKRIFVFSRRVNADLSLSSWQ